MAPTAPPTSPLPAPCPAAARTSSRPRVSTPSARCHCRRRRARRTCVELPQARREKRQRREGTAEDDQAWHDDPRGLHAIEEIAERWRARGDRHRGDAERSRHGLARPRELLGQRLQQHAEGVDEQRRKADEHADARRTRDAPAFIADIRSRRGIPAPRADCSDRGLAAQYCELVMFLRGKKRDLRVRLLQW